MPREVVHPRGHDAPAEPVPVVSWGRDTGYVQIATITADAGERLAEWSEPTAAYQAKVEEYRREHPDGPVTSDNFPVEWSKKGTSFRTFDGFYATLSERWQINDLIRILKRARDQAFGRDE